MPLLPLLKPIWIWLGCVDGVVVTVAIRDDVSILARFEAGTLLLQFPAVFQSVLVAPVHCVACADPVIRRVRKQNGNKARFIECPEEITD